MIRNIGIVSHVDAGKTTVTEQLLFAAGAIRTAGSVDKGTTQTDSLPVERQRGISVRAAVTSLYWRDTKINLIDTPGHVDFSAEIERSLRALDAAVLIVSAVEGVQAHTETIWQALRSLRLPTLIFINKLDRIGADHQNVISEIRQELTPHCLPLQQVQDENNSGARLGISWSATDWESEGNTPFFESIVEAISEKDDLLMEKYLSGESLSFASLDKVLARQTASAECYPVFFGVAKNALGIEPLLNGIVDYLPPPHGNVKAPVSGVVFKIEHDKKLGKVAAVRLFDGRINIRDNVHNNTKNIKEKANQIKRVTAVRLEDVDAVSAGEIAAICGFSKAQVGDVIGTAENVPAEFNLGEPLLTVKVVPATEDEYPTVAAAMLELSEEDPHLGFQWLREQREMHININGWIQIEVLEAILRDRFNVEAIFENPTIIYKETPKMEGVGSERYWMPKPCWAVVDFRLEPGLLGSGVTYESKVSVDKIAAKYQNEIERTIATALKQGTKGWEVTDLKITLIGGEDHTIHSRPGDFITATHMAIMNGLMEAGTTLLEPILKFRVIAPEELFGTIASDLTRLRAVFDAPAFEGGKFRLFGKIPAATSLDYPIKLSSRSGGKGKITTRFDSYAPCTLEQGATTPFRGISPLDRAKYILHARKAL